MFHFPDAKVTMESESKLKKKDARENKLKNLENRGGITIFTEK